MHASGMCVVVCLPGYDFSGLFCSGGCEFLSVEVTTLLLLRAAFLSLIQKSLLIELQF